ncbi:MAG: MATE family efflux transporter [Eubacterium sp.]
MRNISQSKQTVINMAASMSTYIISLLISFFLSPYIVENIGVDANGFITLANNFLGYASLASIALNTLASRFVTVSIHQKDNEKANKYFSSIFYANVFLSAGLAIVFSLILIFLDDIIDVAPSLLTDVRLLFGVLFINSISNTVGSIFSVATFATNKLYLNSIAGIITNFIRVIILIVLFSLFQPKLYYVGISTFCSGFLLVIINFFLTKKLLPQIKIDYKYFELKKVKELISGGIWASVNRLGTILLSDLDLLISNVFIDSIAMGVLSISKTVPNVVNSVVGTIVAVFSPNYTILYAQKKYDELVKTVRRSMKIMGIITNLPVIVLIICGEQFYRLWQPTQDAHELYILSILAIACIIISGGINCIYNIFTVVNKLKLNAVVVIISGLISTALVFVLLKTTNLGIYAIAGVSTVISIIRNLVFTAPYGAKCLNLKWYAFYPEIVKPVIYVALSVVISYFPTKVIKADNWISLFALGILTLVISVLIGYFVILNKEERHMVNNLILKKLKRG